MRIEAICYCIRSAASWPSQVCVNFLQTHCNFKAWGTDQIYQNSRGLTAGSPFEYIKDPCLHDPGTRTVQSKERVETICFFLLRQLQPFAFFLPFIASSIIWSIGNILCEEQFSPCFFSYRVHQSTIALKLIPMEIHTLCSWNACYCRWM